MTLPSLQLAIGLGHVGKESGLMTCTELGRSRSSAQVAGKWPGSQREWSAASLGMRACSGQHGKVLLLEVHYKTVG